MSDKDYVNAQICFVDGEWKLRIPKKEMQKIKDKWKDGKGQIQQSKAKKLQ